MVGSEIVHLLFEHCAPEVLADGFHHFQLVFKPGEILGQPAIKTLLVTVCTFAS